jgi:hypothetical protein
VTQSATSFLGRTVSWIKKTRTSAQHAGGQKERSQAVPLTQVNLLHSIASTHGDNVALGVMKRYDVKAGEPGPLTKYRVRQVLNYVNRVQNRSKLDKLPTELMLNIFDELPYKDLVLIQPTDSFFRAVAQRTMNSGHIGKVATKMLLLYQREAVALARQRTPIDLLRTNRGADWHQRKSAAVFEGKVEDWLAANQPAHVTLPLNSLLPKLRPIVLQALMNCKHLKRLDLGLVLVSGERYTQTLDELGATLPKMCVNNPKLKIDVKVISYGAGLFPAQLSADEMAKLTDLPNVTSLKLSKIGLDDNKVAMLGKLHGLRHLTIEEDDVTEQGLETIGGLPNLESLSLVAPNSNMNVEKMQIIGGMHNLQELGLRVAGLNAEHLAAFANTIAAGNKPSSLTQLDIWGNADVTDEAVPHLLKLPSMENINLGNSGFGDQGALELASATHLGRIDLRNNKIGDDVKARIKTEYPRTSV